MTPDDLLAAFADAADAQREALAGLTGIERRARTDRMGQYHLDTVADAAVLPVLNALPVRVLSEESAWSGQDDAEITVVVDPVDGSTNCSRGIPYWGISLCALDAAGPRCALVENGATGARYTAVRGHGAWLDGERLHASAVTEMDRAVVAIVGMPPYEPPWRQFRSLGSAAVALCDVAAGGLDGFLDCTVDAHCPWDYLGGVLVCRESGAHIADARDRDLVVADPGARRQPVAAGTPELLAALPRRPVVNLDLDHLLTVAVDAALAAGSIVHDGFAAPQNVREKHPGDLVSDTDVASERSIRTALERAAPEIAFFGEEEGGERADVGWFADPLDGTANFVHGFPSVGVSIGLVVDSEPVLGVVYAPMLGNLYSARQGGGAFRDGERIFVSQRVVASAIPATGFPFRAKRERLDEYLPVFGRALREFEDLRRAGAASLDLAWTAAGVFDGYFEQNLGTWDVAAGGLIVREAGGVVTDWQGDEQAWITSGDIVAGPPAVHERILELIAAAGAAM